MRYRRSPPPNHSGLSTPVALLVLALLLTGCSSSPQESPASPASGASPPDATEPAGDSRPPSDEGEPIGLEASVSVDAESAVRQLLPAVEGGTIQLSGADGTGYRLIVPPEALLQDTAITMAPLLDVEGEFVDGLVGGVDLQPAGLRFRQPAILEITPTSTVPSESQVPFMYSGDGSRIGLGYLALGGSGIALQVPHFSGSGILESTEMRMEMNRRLAQAEARHGEALRQKAAELLMAAWERGERTVAGWQGEVREAWLEYYNSYLKPRMEYAERLSTSRNPGDIEYITGVIDDILALERMSQLLGLALEEIDPAFATLRGWAQRMIENVYRGMLDRCLEEHDFSVVPVLAELERAVQILELQGSTAGDPGLQKCLRFDVRFESRLVLTSPDDEDHVTFSTEARVQTVAGVRDTFDAPLPYDVEWQNDPGPWCYTEVIEVTDGTLTVASPRFEWDAAQLNDGGQPHSRPDGRWWPPKDVTLLYDLGGEGGSAEPILRQRTIDGGGCEWSVDTLETDAIGQAWTQLHSADATGGFPGWVATDWEMLFDGELVARREYKQERTVEICVMQILCGAQDATEVTTFELVHAPTN